MSNSAVNRCGDLLEMVVKWISRSLNVNATVSYQVDDVHFSTLQLFNNRDRLPEVSQIFVFPLLLIAIIV